MSVAPQHDPAVTRDPEIARLNDWIAYERSIADWCSRNGKRSFAAGAVEDALIWIQLAARAFTFGCNPLASTELEQNLHEIAQRLPTEPWTAPTNGASSSRWLHVLDKALPYGGHTAMACRWIANDPGSNVHSVALLEQKGPIPELLTQAVQKSGGSVHIADSNESLLTRASWLRKLAFTSANCVVLHMHNANVVAPVAFGQAGGPPVLLVNHAAHIFWLGVSIADVVLNCRGSVLEHEWTLSYRGATRCATLPIPLPNQKWHNAQQAFSPQERSQAKRDLNLPDNSIVLLTVGAQFKYWPVPDQNFFRAAETILASCPRAYLLAVGPSEDGHWGGLRRATSDRVKVMGHQANLRPFHAAADVYLEGFPFGSTTSLLEAGSVGIPTILAPESCPPPFGTDGLALDNVLTRPISSAHYVQAAQELLNDAGERVRLGLRVAHSIARHHLGDGWARHLAKIADELPATHAVSTFEPKSPPESAVLHWTRFASDWPTAIGRYRGDILEFPFRLAVENGLKPRIDNVLYQACRKVDSARRDAGAPLFVYRILGVALRVMPAAVALAVFDSLVTLFRANGRMRRTMRSALSIGRRRLQTNNLEGPQSHSVLPSVGQSH